jgi:AraC-like DNA-binding protein
MIKLETELDIPKVVLEPNPVLLDSGCRRSSTVALRYRAVERAILMMRERFMEPVTLTEIADEAQLSPFHFNRVFRSMIGIPPTVFLAALRMEEAKKLLLTTRRSVTDVCFDVGYTSLGTFTSRFSLFVGLSPSRFRLLAQEKIMHSCPQELRGTLERIQLCQNTHPRACVTGSIDASLSFDGLILVGMFSDPLPQGQPMGCTILMAPGQYRIPPVPDGQYYLFAAAMDQSQDFLTVLAYGTSLHGGLGMSPVTVQNGRTKGSIDITLVATSWADPPVVVAFPWLLMSRFLQYTDLVAEAH